MKEDLSVKISAVIITYNEEKNIERCLKSLQGIADEIVVVDSYSDDKTAEICQSFNVKFVLHPFEGYVSQKNYVLGLAMHDHVLSLDADESISAELRESILKVKDDWQYDGYKFNRLTNYCGKWVKYAGWYPDAKIRLWKKGKGKWEGISLHEKLVMEKNSTVGFLKGDLLHYSYHSLAQHVEKTNTFSDLAAQEAFSKAERSSLIQIIFSPGFVFVKKYFFQRGFTGGWTGFTICIISAFGKFLKYVKMKELRN